MQLTRRDLIKGGMAAGSLLMIGGPVGRIAAADLPSVRPLGTPQIGPWRVLAGSLHDHSTDSDGDSASEAVTAWLHAHRAELGIDFMTLSDHSDFFPVSYDRTNDPADPWGRQATLMQQYNSPDFSLLRGFEWTNDQQNHLNVLLSQQWTTRFITGDQWLSMRPFWEWMTLPAGIGGADGIGQFNHPGDKGALNWDDYALDLPASQRMCTIEIRGSQGRDGRGSSDAGWYWFALAQGWHVSPTMNWDWHDWAAKGVLEQSTPGADYGDNGFLPGQRSLVLATDSQPSSIREALLARRTTATEIPDLWAMLSGRVKAADRGHGHGKGHGAPAKPAPWTPQGGEIAVPTDGLVELRVEFGSPTEAVTRVDFVGDNGVSPYPYYYADNADWSGNHSQLTISYVVQHGRWTETNGHATRKDRVDGPPEGTVLASVPVDEGSTTVGTTLPLPAVASPRPDGKHFVYAIAYAGDPANPARCWTGPLLLSAG